jgi:chaperonin GroES
MASKKKAKKPAVKKSVAKKVAAKKPLAKKAPAKKAKPAPKKAVKTKSVKKAAAPKKVVAKKTVVTKAAPAKKVDYSKAITPLGDRLVVRVVNSERITAGGLIIPDTVSDAVGFLKATVLAVGRGTQNKKGFIKTMDVQVGDAVLFSQYAGTKVQFNQEDLQIIHETDVMGIVQK